MKNKPFYKRLGFAWAGIKIAWQNEASFRTQAAMAMGAAAVLLVLRPRPIWWAIFFLTIGTVLACELINTALELVVDRLHPETHPMIARAKDCAAGAVLIFSLVSVAVFIALLVDRFA